MTFSKDLALFIQAKNPDHQIWKLDFQIGPEASNSSSGCVFGILSSKTHRLLRGAITYEEAAFLTTCSSRYAAELRLQAKELWREAIT